jgi:hypothetical protein
VKQFVGVLVAAGMAASGAAGQGIARVPVFGLPDVAQADATQRVVYYDPEQMQALGVDMALFVMAHEEAHVRLGHRHPGTDADSLTTRNLEREADCEAAARLAATPWNAERVLRFFDRIGVARPDADHPTGTERAATIRGCTLAHRENGRSVAVGRSPDAPLRLVVPAAQLHDDDAIDAGRA